MASLNEFGKCQLALSTNAPAAAGKGGSGIRAYPRAVRVAQNAPIHMATETTKVEIERSAATS